MKRFLTLLIIGLSLLFISPPAFAQAHCSLMVTDLETQYSSYLYLEEVECPKSPTLYVNLSKLAEGYGSVAQCFKEEANADSAAAYYSLSGAKYALSADALCDKDHSLKTRLYISSGDAYVNANLNELARLYYNKAIDVFNAHASVKDPGLFASANQKLYELNNPLIDDFKEVGNKEDVDWLPLAIAFIVFGVSL